jgi:voltage-gated potassium channel
MGYNAQKSMKAVRNLELIGLALAGIVVAGTLGFHFIEHWPLFDSLYMTVTTLTTIGYQETHPLSHAGRVFNIFLIVTGVSLLFLAVGTLTEALLQFELSNFFGRRKMEREIARLSDHYIICGAGRVGRSVARELERQGAPFVIIETQESKALKHVAHWPHMIADATQESTLLQAHIQRARGLVAATTTDATNIYIVLTARSLNPKLKIIARASEEDAEKHLLTAGADTVVSPYNFAGHRIAQAFIRPNVLDFIDSASGVLGLDLEIAEIHIEASSPFAGQTVRASRIRSDMGVIVLAIRREDGQRFTPKPEDRIQPGDVLIAMGEPKALRKLEAAAIAAPRLDV